MIARHPLESKLGLLLVSLGSARFTGENCRSLFAEAARHGIHKVLCVFLDSLEELNLRALFGLEGEDLKGVVRERVIRLTALIRETAGDVAEVALLSECAGELQSLPTRQAQLRDLFSANNDLLGHLESQTFRNLHPILKRLGAKNQRAPVVTDLSQYLLDELALKLALRDSTKCDWELAFTHELESLQSEIDAAVLDHGLCPWPPLLLIQPSTNSGLAVSDITYGYDHDGGFALKNCTFLGKPGEIVGVLGPSGSGKSTLLRIVAGHLAPHAGTVRIGDVDVTTWPASQRSAVTVFQDFALFPHLTVRENVAFGLESQQDLAADEADAITDILLARLDLDTFARRRPKGLSGGQRQRVAIARALAVSPTVLLLDEPTASLDFRARDELGELLFHVVTLPPVPTILVVSHDRDFVLDVASTLVVLDEGRVLACGPTRDVVDSPPSAEVARIVGGHLTLPRASVAPIMQVGDVAECRCLPVGQDEPLIIADHRLGIRPDAIARHRRLPDSLEEDARADAVVMAVLPSAKGVRLILRVGGQRIRVTVAPDDARRALQPGDRVHLFVHPSL